MKLSEKNQELLDQLYPDGYEIKKVDLGDGKVADEGDNYHLLFVKIFPTPGQDENFRSPMIQQFSIKDWQAMQKMLNKGHKLKAFTGYNRFTIIHDPIEAEAKLAAEKEAAELKKKEDEEKAAEAKAEKARLAAEKKAAEKKEPKAKPGPKPKEVESHN